jgi:lipid-binding SYLF domain-containing protein
LCLARRHAPARGPSIRFSRPPDKVQSARHDSNWRRTLARQISLEKISMKMPSALGAAVLALAALAGVTLSSAARADEGFVQLTIYKAGWVIGGSGGSGVLDFRGRRYPLSTGGLDYGFVFGGSKTILRGRVSNIYRPSDVAGVYGAAGAGLAVGRGARAIVLTNQKGAVLELAGHQVGLMANADLSGLAITMR